MSAIDWLTAGGTGLLNYGGNLLGGLFGGNSKPYDDAMKQYKAYADKAQGVQNPYLQAGQGAIPNYQDWLNGQKDPSGFINHLMGQYQESPYAQYEQQQAMRAGQNAASASGMMGSTPFAQQLQQNASNISSQDMNQWLQNVLGINTQYGQGEQNLMTTGQNAANSLTNMYGHMGDQMGEQSYNKAASGQNSMWNNLGTLGSLAGMLGGL